MTIFEYEIEAEPDGRGTKLEGVVTISETTIDRKDNDLAVLLLHGAGGDLHGGHLDDTSDYLAWMGFPVVRVTMKSPAALYRMRAAHAAMAAAKELDAMKHVKRWILMGHSNGARVAIALASEMLDARRLDNNEDLPLGVVLFSFPLHAPGKHDDLRDDELMSLELPTFIVRGTRDTFSRQDLFDSAMKTMSDAKKAFPIIVHDVIGGNHSLQVPKSSKDTTTEIELDGVRTAVTSRRDGPNPPRPDRFPNRPAEPRLAESTDAFPASLRPSGVRTAVTNFCISLKNIAGRAAGRGANGTTR